MLIDLEKIKQSKLFSGEYGKILSDEILSKFHIDEINFPVRFRNVLKNYSRSVSKIFNLLQLLNIDSENLLSYPNCGAKSIKEARNIILIFLENKIYEIKTKVESIKVEEKIFIEKKIIQTPFYTGINGYKIDDSILENIKITDLNFGNRFLTIINNKNNLNNLNDLLNLDFVDLLYYPYCSLKLIEDARKLIIGYINNNPTQNNFINKSTDNKIDDKIVNIIKNILIIRSLNYDRDFKVFLNFLSYQSSIKKTLESIGIEFKITRERARQIVGRINSFLSENQEIKNILLNIISEYSLIFELEDFLNHLLEKGLIHKNNKLFMQNIIVNFLINKNILKNDSAYYYIVNNKINKFNLNKINNVIISYLGKSSKELKGINIDNVLSVIKATETVNVKIDINFLKYLSFKYKNYAIKDLQIYPLNIYNILYSKKLIEVIKSSLEFLVEPIHFTQLTKFIRDNNLYFKEISNESIHSSLIRYDFCHDVDRGIYALKSSNLPKHISAGEAIIDLLSSKGPMLEKDIISKLKDTYSSWNINLAIINNSHKLVKIGNNLYDIKR